MEVRSNRTGNKPQKSDEDKCTDEDDDTTSRAIRYVRTDDENDADDVVNGDAGVRARATMRADDARGVPAWSFGEGNDDDDDDYWQDRFERNDVDQAPSGRRARVRGGGRRA